MDPKGVSWKKYQGCTIITPNFKEFCDITKRKINNIDEEIVKNNFPNKLSNRYEIDVILLTRSEKGMTLFDNNKILHFKSLSKEVFDVPGAGDTVVATLASCISSGLPLKRAVELSNKAAGIVVSKFGTSPITLSELKK